MDFLLQISFLTFREPSRKFTDESRQRPSTTEEFSDEELNDLIALNRFNQIPELPKSTTPDEIKPVTKRPSRPQRPSKPKPLPPSRGPLQCFSCGSLLNAENNCTDFNPRDINQAQTCGVNEACLLYTWRKSPTGNFVHLIDNSSLIFICQSRFLISCFNNQLQNF